MQGFSDRLRTVRGDHAPAVGVRARAGIASSRAASCARQKPRRDSPPACQSGFALEWPWVPAYLCRPSIPIQEVHVYDVKTETDVNMERIVLHECMWS